MLMVVDDFTVSVKPGECVGIMGHSGCGKTTLLRILAGLLSPDSGSVDIQGKDGTIQDHPVAFVFQEPYLLPWRTVYKNVLLTLQITDNEQSRDTVVDHWLSVVGLIESKLKYPHELSGGMRSRCALARALAMETDFLFMDEPFGNLDAATRFELQEVVRRVIRERERIAVIVTHSINEAIFMCDEIFAFKEVCGGVESQDYLRVANPLHDAFSRPADVWESSGADRLRRQIVNFMQQS